MLVAAFASRRFGGGCGLWGESARLHKVQCRSLGRCVAGLRLRGIALGRDGTRLDRRTSRYVGTGERGAELGWGESKLQLVLWSPWPGGRWE